MLRFALRFAVLGLTLSLAALPAIAQYPERPIRLVVPYAPGGGTDNVARLLAAKLGARLTQPVVVENKAGANGIIGSDAVAKSAADGYTLLLAGLGPLAVNPSLFQKMPYEPARAFAPIVKVSSAALVLVVPGVSKDGLKEIVAGAKSKPGELNIANAGEGSPQHICAELFARSAGIRVNHIPYKGAAPAVTDLLGGACKRCVTTWALSGLSFSPARSKPWPCRLASGHRRCRMCPPSRSRGWLALTSLCGSCWWHPLAHRWKS